MRIGLTIGILFAVCISTVSIASADEFSSLWYDGNAEISTYRISEMRYGEPHEGIRIMVFVTEPMCLKTHICLTSHIKPDKKKPGMEAIKVIKLNDIRKFPTGIYDYSAMTSVFAAVEKKNNIPLMGVMKVTFTSQEWCGTVYERMLRKDKSFKGMLHSYFESEGEKEYSIPHNRMIQAEENLWIIIRELKGRFLKNGESRKMKVIPSMWSRRKTHIPAAVVDVTISKGEKEKRNTALGAVSAYPFTWKFKQGETTVWIEAAYPHRILSWKEADGSTGEILASRREPYWKQNKNQHLHLRDKLGL